LKVAHWLKRDYVGYEIISKYATMAARRIKEPLSLRSQQLIAVFDKVGLDDPVGQGQTGRPNKRKRAGAGDRPIQTSMFEPKAGSSPRK
jgi:hypothetical protein